MNTDKPKATVRKGKAARLSQPHRDRTKYTRKPKHARKEI